MRCFFNLIGSDETIFDDKGVEVADLEEAKREAMKALTELRREDPTVIRDWTGWRLQIADDAGATLSTIDLALALHSTAGPAALRAHPGSCGS